MRKTNFMRSLKRRALPLLTSVAMAISMLSGTGLTAMASKEADVIILYNPYHQGGLGFEVDYLAGFQDQADATKHTITVNSANINSLLPDYDVAFGKGYTLTWEVGGGRIYNPTKDTIGNVEVPSQGNTITLNAVLVRDPIALKYELGGGHYVTGDPDNPAVKAFNTDLGDTISEPVLEGYDFMGWDLDGDGSADTSKTDGQHNQAIKIDEKAKWNKHNGSATLTAVWHANKGTILEDAGAAEDLVAEAQALIAEADAAAKAAEAAAKSAEEAAKAANDNPTADTAAAARKAADAATTAAENATKAYDKANEAFKAASKANADVEAAATKAGTKNDPEIKPVLESLTKSVGAALDKLETASKAVTTQAAAANKAAENALAAATEADKNDGSEPGKLAPVGSKLKDANGDYTGYVVTNADPSNPEVEYVATDADKKAKKISLPETVKDRSGNEYKVTSIAAKALERADVKEIIIPKSVKKIGDKAFYKSKAKKITIKTTKKGKIKIGDKAFRVKPDKAKIRVKGAKGKYKDKIVKHVKKNAKKTADVK